MQGWQRRTYIILLLTNVGFFFGVGLYFNFLPLFLESLGADPVSIGFVYAINFVTVAISTIMGGYLADRFDKKKLFIASYFVVLPAPLIYFFSTSWVQVIPGIIMEAFSYFAWPVLESYLGAVVPEKQRGFYFNLSYAANYIGLVPAPLVGGIIVNIFGYQVLFLMVFVSFFFTTFLTFIVTPVQKSVGGEGLFRLLNNRKLWGVFTLTAIMNGAFSFVTPYVPLFLQDAHSLIETEIGIIMTIGNLAAAILSPLIGQIADRIGKLQAMIIPVLSLSTSHFLLILIPTPNLLLWYSILYAPWLCFQGCVSSYVVDQLHPADQGKGLGISVFLSQFPRAFTPIIGGQQYALNIRLPFQTLQISLIPALALIGYSIRKQYKPLSIKK